MEFPEIQRATHIETHQLLALSPIINHNNHAFEIEAYYTVDSSFFEVFDFEVLHGDIKTAVSTPFSIILTESEASRIFNTQDPIGKPVTWKIFKDFTYTVKAIVKDPPQNSSIRFNGLVSEASIGKMGMRYPENWGFTIYETYLRLHPDVNTTQLEQKLREFLIDYYKTNFSTTASSEDAIHNSLELHSLREAYFNEGLTNDTTNRGNIFKVRILITVGIIIMLLSIINYIILSIAKATTRSNEIGVQKVLGAGRRSLLLQYVTETIIICLFAALIGLIFAGFLLPQFSQFMSLDQSLKLSSFELLLIFPGALVLGIVAGIYPAFVISSQSIIDILKKSPFQGNKGIIFRNALIIFQFSASIVLIANTILINKQVEFMKTNDLGIRKENVVFARLPMNIMRGNKEVFRDRIMKLPDVQEVCYSSTMFGKFGSLNSMELDGKVVNFASIWVDADFPGFYDLKLTEGRMFSQNLRTDLNATAVLNESAVREFNVEDPFKIKIRVPGGSAKVVGIVRDFNFQSLHNSIEPLAIVYLPRQGSYVSIKILGSNQLSVLKEIDEIWEDLAPGFPFSYQFLDSSLESMYKKDEQMGQAIMYFSLIAIAIAVLGIFSLSLLISQKRVKELSIHKINGAKSRDLLLLLNRSNLIILAVSLVVATPVAWYSMSNWLEGFAYKSDIGIWIYFVSGILVSVVTLTVVSWQGWRFAKVNPVDGLRYE
jgi:putative ABC transport system permease protein